MSIDVGVGEECNHGHILKHFGAREHTLDKTFGGAVDNSMSNFMTGGSLTMLLYHQSKHYS